MAILVYEHATEGKPKLEIKQIVNEVVLYRFSSQCISRLKPSTYTIFRVNNEKSIKFEGEVNVKLN